MRSRVATRLLRGRSRGELPPTPRASTSSPGPRPVRWRRQLMRIHCPAPSSMDTVSGDRVVPAERRAVGLRVSAVILADFSADRLPGYSGWIA
jgi:hypothetical protein